MVNETQSSNRRSVIILAIGALVLVAIAAILIVTLVLRGGDSGEGVTAEAAKLMPADTLFFMSMNPDLTAADNFDVVRQAWGDIPEFAKAVDNWPGVLFEDVEEMDYATDIGSWLGSEISIGMMGDLTAIMSQGMEMSLSGIAGESPEMGAVPAVPQFVVTAATQDTAASDKFLAKLRGQVEKDGTVLQETDYQGIQIVYSESKSEEEPGMAYATFDGSIVFTVGGLETMQSVIDARDGDNLAGSAVFEKTMSALPEGSAGFGYMNMGQLSEALLNAIEETSAEMGASEQAALGALDPEQIKAFEGAGFSFGFESNGIRFDAVTVYDKDKLPESMPATANPNKAVSHTPADTLVYLSSADLGGVVKSIMDLAMTQPDMGMEDFEESLEMLETQLGIKLDDLYEALSGEFSVAITYDAAGIMGDPSVPVGALLQLENKKEETFKQLMSVAGLALLGSGSDMVDTVEIGDVSVTLVKGPTGEPIVGWGLSKEFFALGTSQKLLETAFDGGAKLADDPTFKAVTAALPEDNAGYFYLNLAQGMDVVYQAMSGWEQEDFDREARPVLEPIKALGAASQPVSRDKDTASTTLFLLLEGQ
jgi:hypothetical protein